MIHYPNHYSVEVRVSSKSTIIKEPGEHRKSLIRFSLSPDSTHSQLYWGITPPEVNVRGYLGRDETHLAGPTVELRLQDFAADSRKFAKNYGVIKDVVRRPSLFRGLGGEDHYCHHGAVAALLSGLEVSDDARLEILDKLIAGADVEIAKQRGGDRFDVDVAVHVRVKTIIIVVFEEDDDYNSHDDIDWMVPAAKEAIEGLERVRFDDLAKVKGVNEDDQRQCVICYEDFEGESLVTRLECCHLFHSDCLCAWLEKSHYCPLCRFQLAIRVS